MRRQRMVLVCLLAFLVTACNRGSLTSPDPPLPSPHSLISTWQYNGDNFPEDAVGKLTACMIEQEDVAPDTAAWVAESIMRTAEHLSWSAPAITFNQDGTYTTANNTSAGYNHIAPQVSPLSEPDRSTSGTLVVSGALLVLIEDGADSVTTVLTLAVMGEQLKLSRAADGYDGFPTRAPGFYQSGSNPPFRHRAFLRRNLHRGSFRTHRARRI